MRPDQDIVDKIRDDINSEVIDVCNKFKCLYVEKIGAPDFIFCCVLALIHALVIVVFTKLSPEGIETSYGLLDSIVKSVQLAGEAAIAARRKELEIGEDAEDSSQPPSSNGDDPWS